MAGQGSREGRAAPGAAVAATAKKEIEAKQSGRR